MQTIEVITKDDFDFLLQTLNEIKSEIKELRADIIPVEPPKEKEILTIKEASEMLGFAVITIRNYVAKREIPFIQTMKNGAITFRKSDLEQWVTDRTKLTNKQISQKASEMLDRM